MTHQLVFITFWAASCAFAGLRGGPPERTTAIAFLLTIPLSVAAERPHAILFQSVEWSVVGVDVGLLAFILWLALRSTRFWPMPMASVHLLGVLGHLVKPLSPVVMPAVYYSIVSFGGYLMLVLLVVGTVRHRRRLARYGIDYAWTQELPPAYRHGWSIDGR